MSSAPVTLSPWVDDFDDHVDTFWELLRGNPVLDRLFYSASTVGDFSAVWHAINLARLATAADGRTRFVRLATALAIESLLVNQVIKRAFRRERPEPPEDGDYHLRIPLTSSFPSGHASSAAMAARLLGQRSKLAPAYALIAGVVATSRLHVRIHHASDVIAGAAVGLSLASIYKRAWPLS